MSIWKEARVFRGRSSLWRALLEKIVPLMVTLQLDAKGANHAKTRRKTSQEERASYRDPEKGQGLTSAQNHGHNKTGVSGGPESECTTAVGKESRSQTMAECEFPFKKNGPWLGWLSWMGIISPTERPLA